MSPHYKAVIRDDIVVAARRAIFFSVVFFIALISAIAQETPEATTEDDDIVITATRLPEKSIEVPQYVTVITAGEIRTSGKNTLTSILEDEAGLLCSDQGPSGGIKNIWMRGAPSARVLVLLDGVPQNNARDGQMDLSLIPTDIIEKIEIVQGGMSIVYGADAIGGVVNIITNKNLADKSLVHLSYLSTSYLPREYTDGSVTYESDLTALYDGKSISLSAAHDFGFMNVLATGNFTQTDNGYYYENGGDLYRMTNADVLGGNGLLSLTFPWETGNATIKGLLLARETGVPGSKSYPTPNNSQEDMQIEMIASYSEQEFFSRDITLDARVSFAQSNRTYYFPPSSAATELTSVTADLHQKYSVTDFISAVYGGNFAVDYIQSEYLGDRTRLHGSIFASLPFLATSSIEITPAIRYDLYTDVGGDLSWGLGSVLFISDSSSLKFSISKSFHVPTLFEIHDPFMGNGALKPESGYSTEIGFSLADSRIRMETAIFARLVTDEIKSYPPDYIPYNMDSSFYSGIQAHIEWEFASELFLETDATFLYSFDLSDGNTLADDVRIALVPMWKASIALRWQTKTLTARLAASFTGDRYVDNTMADTLPMFFILDASLRYTAADWLSFFLAVDNLLDTSYELVKDYPMPGLTIKTGIEISF
ncbi:MAG: TonB-dependent receptor [Spirochaetaceae bacterium]|nr:MAG: TonB-dependent receptor [Spirochaetaceae bacterium]